MRTRPLLLILSIILFFPVFSKAQGENLFTTDVVHEIYLSFDDADFWNQLSANYDNNYPNVPYLMANAIIDGESVDSIGVRLKGFSSYWVQTDKKSIKLDFNEYVSGKKYDGLKKVNLNNGEGDPAIQRDKICYDLMNEAGVSAPRTAYTKVYLNDEYWGLYLLVEQIDRTFINQNFNNSEGALFKNMANSELGWLGSDTTDYQNIFELKTGHDEGAWERFVHLMDVINNASNAEFKDSISKIFDVELYLKVLAVDAATNNWDSYLDHGRNFYLYEDDNSKKFKWIPWDYNLAIGGQFSSFLNNDVEIEDPSQCNTILNGTSPYPADDTIFIQVVNLDDFCCNVDWDGVCQNIYDDIESGGDGNVGGGGTGPPPGFNVTYPVDMSNSPKVLINRLLAVPEFEEKYYQYWCTMLEDNLTTERLFPMIDSAGNLIRDYIYIDSNYVWTNENFEEDLDQGNTYVIGLKKFFEDRIPILNQELENLFDCNSLVSTLEPQDIVINEFMASNDSLSGLSDAAGEYDDWIELYNNTSETIDLTNAFLSDDINDPHKWSFPIGTTIDSGAYLIVWADEDEGQEGLHANFKLAKAGEYIQLTDYDSVIDSISYDEQVTNLTASRIPNGTGNFIIQTPTYSDNNENGITSIADIKSQDLNVNIFPNPANHYLNILLEKPPSQGTKVSLFNSVGQQVIAQQLTNQRTTLFVQSLTPGMYILKIENRREKISFNHKVVIYSN